MRIVRQWTKSLSLSVESLLDDLENHEARVNALLREVERGSVRIRAQRAGCERRLSALEQACEQQRADEQRWRERAVRLQDQRERALECVKRSRLARERAEQMARDADKQRELLAQLVADEQAVQAELGELQKRRAALLSRDARAVASSALHGESAAEIESVFDRWQARVEEREAQCSLGRPQVDSLERELRGEEDRAEVERELDALLKEQG